MTASGATDSIDVAADQASDYSITVRNCNSIDQAHVELRRGGLNVKYGPNGIGKSTIARALKLNAEGGGGLEALTPFKGGANPSVEGADSIASVLTFDDEYVSQFVFTQDEVLKDSFEIFINTEEFQTGLMEIEELLVTAKNALIDDPQFAESLADFKALHDAFGVTKTGELARNSRGYKALAVAGALENIPQPLAGYSDFIRSSAPADWVTWQSKGQAFLDHSESCPFCSKENINKATVRKVSEVYESALVKTMSALRSTIARLGRYLAPSSLELLSGITGSLAELTPEQAQFLAKLHGDIATFVQKLDAIRALSFATLRDVDNVESRLDDLSIDMKFLTHLESEATGAIVELVNTKIAETKATISQIREKLGKQSSRVKKLIQRNEKLINDFLESAGYRYIVRVEPAGDSYRMILEHRDAAGHIAEAVKHLSYGERNAFALVLFMHQVAHDKPDLVVLDDPVSSFDKTKKFAIFHKLFTGRDSIRGVTTLFLTHDIEPVIDMIRTGTARFFTEAEPAASFLRSRSGVVTEQTISRDDVQSFSSVCAENVGASDLPLVRCIYLRRLLEVVGGLDAAYDVLASLLHGRATPTARVGGSYVPLEGTDVAAGIERIRSHISDFDYDELLAERLDAGRLHTIFGETEVGYERLQITRLLIELDVVGGPSAKVPEALMKFINESYHVENEYLFQLNPRKFDAVPEYVLGACEELVGEIKARTDSADGAVTPEPWQSGTAAETGSGAGA